MADFMAHFHFIRPWVLLALLPLLLVALLLRRQVKNTTGWRDLIAPELLGHLLDGESQKTSRSLLKWLATGWLIATLALAGPAWEERPSPVHQQADALVIVLDLSPSMVAEDITPTRMVRARLKLADILKRRQEGETALIVYGDDAYVVSPFTTDSNTIASILPMLSPGIMPLPGSQTEAGLARAVQMLEQAGFTQGQILLITDGVDQRALPTIDRAFDNTRFGLSILGIGTDEGAPIPSGSGGFVRDSNNAVIISRLDSERLATLARKHNGRYRTSHFDNSDLDALLDEPSRLEASHNRSEQNINQWYDRGPWLVLLLLPLVLYSFRRGVLVVLLLLPISMLYSPNSMALNVDDLWLNRDQQGARALAEGDATSAQQRFKDPEWKATAAYRAEDYETAAQLLAGIDTARAHYNRGNALAHTGKLEDAIAAYQQALKLDPDFQQAADNKALLEMLKEQQEQQQQSEQEDGGDGEENNQQQDDSSESDSDSSNSEQSEADSNNDSSNDNATSNSGTDNPDPSSGDYTPEPEDIGDEQGQQQPEQPQPDGSEEQDGDQQGETEVDGSNTEEGAEQQSHLAEAAMTDEEREAEQALEQWLRQIPDDPSGLLRNKFRYEYQQKQSERIQQRFDAQDSDQQRW